MPFPRVSIQPRQMEFNWQLSQSGFGFSSPVETSFNAEDFAAELCSTLKLKLVRLGCTLGGNVHNRVQPAGAGWWSPV